MNLIEELGGYSAAKAEANAPVKLLNFLNYDELNKQLLEYRRQHNIFEVDDYVFHTVCKNPLLERVTWTDGKRIRTDIAGGSAPIETFVHATDAEIKARRILP